MLEVGGSNGNIIPKKVAHLRKHVAEQNSDFLLLTDCHSDYKSGELIYGVNRAGQDVSDSVDKVPTFFVFVFLLLFLSLFLSNCTC